ncbi:MAG: AMP-binding protein, partial [Promethearchaeota archaeon]
MLKEPIPKESDLIDPKEYRKRRKLLFKKHGQLIKKIMELPIENKITWGSIVEENALKYSDKIAIKFEDTKLTYKEFNEWVNRYAHYFISSGLKKSDVVEIFLTNRPELLIIFTAISKIGAISSLINTDLRGSGLAYCLNKTPGKFIIIGSELIDAFTNVKSDLNLSKDQLLLFCPDRDSVKVPDEFIDLNKVVKNFPSNNPTFMDNVKTNDPIAYLFTSGTTGLPKAAITNHRKLVTQAYYFGQAVFELTPEDTVYVPLPFFHGTAIWLGWGPAFGGGAALALRRKFSVSHFWEDIRKFNATVFTYVGELCRYIMNQSPAPNDRNNPVRKIIGNGLRPEIWKAFKERFDIEFVCEIY